MLQKIVIAVVEWSQDTYSALLFQNSRSNKNIFNHIYEYRFNKMLFQLIVVKIREKNAIILKNK